jgi:monooxygenase
MAAVEYVDVLIVGAGLSGIGAAWHVKNNCPRKSFAIIEGRDAIGGTWDLFRYPGIRSDSDMYTLGYRFKPWTDAKAIADAPAILNYLHETADENGLTDKIRYHHRLVAADWDSSAARWTVTIERGAEKERAQIACSFLYMCTGYYSYAEGHRPDFAGEADFKGDIVHPQFWPEQLDYQGKNVVVIGSGATAVTLVPAMVKDGAGHVTMLQRSPTYVVSRPGSDKIANWLRAKLPGKIAYGMTRWKNVLIGTLFFNLAQKRPEKSKERMIAMVRDELGADYDVQTHFTPRYNPWDQRVCLIPDSDMFQVIKQGRADVVTDQIDCFTANGIMLKSGKELPADIIVTATGLKMEVMSGVQISVDGQARPLKDTVSYKGFMYSSLPNLASAFGYSNASWTLKADLIAEYVCRLINHLDANRLDWCMPDATGVEIVNEGLLTLKSGYVARALDKMPKTGTKDPWKAYHNYLKDMVLLRHGKLDDGAMTFGRKSAASATVQEAEPVQAAA